MFLKNKLASNVQLQGSPLPRAVGAGVVMKGRDYYQSQTRTPLFIVSHLTCAASGCNR